MAASWDAMKIMRSMLLLTMTLILVGCAPTPQDVVGRYTREKSPDNLSYEIKRDGSFVEHKDGRQIKDGHWHFTKHLFFDTGIELDSDGSADVDSSADEYRLVFRDGRYCWEVERDFDYWCQNGNR
jgi:hypothetical protein